MEKKIILVVDDYEINTYTISFTLKRANYDVLTANSGQEALTLAKSKKFDMVLTDYKMPGMDGVEFITELRKMPGFEEIPVIFLTSETSSEKKEKAASVGALSWIQKPYEVKHFLAVVDKTMSAL